jgi:transposase
VLKWEEASRVYVFTRPVDMRCGFDRLAEMARAEVGCNPLSGGLFVFLSRGRRRVKILTWDRDGYWLHYKRLEAGAFKVETRDGYEELTGVDLKLLLEGVELSRIKFRRDAAKGVYA